MAAVREIRRCLEELGFMAIRVLPWLWIDTSAYTAKRFPASLIDYMRGHGRTKVLFGTNYPMITPAKALADLDGFRMDRILYGSDFPNIPYAWDRELKRLGKAGLSWDRLEWMLNKSAAALFSLD